MGVQHLIVLLNQSQNPLTRVCSRCGIEKGLEAFKSTRYVRSRCSDCYIQQYTNWNRWQKQHPDYVKNKELKRKYKFSIVEYKVLLEKQNGVCAICCKAETRKFKGTIVELSVDHCHKTGKVRGLLCTRCNRTLGMFKDSIGLFESAIEYLRQVA